jgi:hypothetical protein
MDLSPEDLAANYAGMVEDELLELARSYESLTESAQAVLRAEFARRHLDPPMLEEVEDVPVTNRNLVTIRHYRDLSEAIVARSLLESAGIEVFLRDENLVRLDWQVSNFIGGIRLQVEAKDEAAAVELLSQAIPNEIPFDSERDFRQPHCPECGSMNITFQGSSRGAALTSISFFALPLPLGGKTWSCDVCGAQWKETQSA